MASRNASNVDTLGFLIDLSGQTNDVSILLCALPKDYQEVENFTVAHRTAGVGAQNITYAIKSAPAQTNTPFTVVSTSAAAIANASANVSTIAFGNGAQATALAESRNLFLDVDFAAAVTSGPVAYVCVALRK